MSGDKARLEICKDFQGRTEKRMEKLEINVNEIKVSQSASNEKLENVCLKMESLTKAIWGLVSSVIVMFISFVTSIILKII